MGEEAAPWALVKGQRVTLAAVHGQVWASVRKAGGQESDPSHGLLDGGRGEDLRGMKPLPLLHRPFQLL